MRFRVHLLIIDLTPAPLSIKVGVEALNSITSSSLQRVAKLIVQLGANAAIPGLEHFVTETNIRPAIPTNNRTGVEHAEGVLRAGDIVIVGKTEAVSTDTVLVVNELRTRSVGRELVAGLVVFTVA